MQTYKLYLESGPKKRYMSVNVFQESKIRSQLDPLYVVNWPHTH